MGDLRSKPECHAYDCIILFAGAGAVAVLMWVSVALSLWSIKERKKKALGKQRNEGEVEMEYATIEQKGERPGNLRTANGNDAEDQQVERRDSILYSTIVFKDGKKKPDSYPQDPENSTTYACVNHKQKQPPEESALYAQVVRKKT